jgi:hypothetical protein
LIGREYEVAIDDHADRKSRPDGDGRLDVEVAANDLLAGLVQAIGACSRLILKNEADSRTYVNTRSKKISEKLQPVGPGGKVRPEPVHPRSVPARPPLELKRLACYFCAGK